MQWVGRRKCRRIVAAGPHRGADRFGKAYPAIPTSCLRDTRPIRINGNLAFSIALTTLASDSWATAGVGAGAKRAASGTRIFSVNGSS